MASQQDQQARPPLSSDSKFTMKRPLESSPSGGAESNKPAPKMQKLDIPPASAPPKQPPIQPKMTQPPKPAMNVLPGGDIRGGSATALKQPEAPARLVQIPVTREERPKAPQMSGVPAGPGSKPENRGVDQQQQGPPGANNIAMHELPPRAEPAKTTPQENSAAVQKGSKPQEGVGAQVLEGGAGMKEREKDGGGGKEGVEEGGDKETGRRMLRPRQSSQPPQGQKTRFRSREGEIGSPGPDHSLLYKEGGGVPDLGATYDATPQGDADGKNLVEVRIPPEAVTLTNKQVRARQLWGTDVYSDDSDMVAVLMHAGYYTPSGSPPPPSVVELRVVVRLMPPQEGYPSSARNNIRSRAWGAAKSGCSFRVEKCWVVKVGGGTLDLEPSLSRNLAAAPSLVPAATERTVTTRSSAQAASNRQRYLQEVTVQYNLCNEPWMKYSLSAVADRGLKPSQFTSSRLKKGDVLYLETHTTRFELSHVDQTPTANGTIATSAPFATSASSRPSSSHGLIHTLHSRGALERPGTPQHDHPGYEGEKYRFAKCKRALPLGVMRKKGIPLPSEELEVMEDGVVWDSIEWSPSAVWVRGKEFPLARVQFMGRIVPIGVE